MEKSFTYHTRLMFSILNNITIDAHKHMTQIKYKATIISVADKEQSNYQFEYQMEKRRHE